MQPKLEYVLRTMLPNHSWVKNLDDVVQEMVKEGPSASTKNSYIFLLCAMEAQRIGAPQYRERPGLWVGFTGVQIYHSMYITIRYVCNNLIPIHYRQSYLTGLMTILCH